MDETDTLRFETRWPDLLLSEEFGLPRDFFTETAVEAILDALAACGALISGPGRGDRAAAHVSEGIIVSGSRGVYSLNVTKTLWTALGLTLDAAGAMGIASASLATLGVTSQALSKLSEPEGEVCAFRVLAGRPGGVNEAELLEIMHRSDGFNPVPCRWKREGACTMSRTHLSTLLQGLKARGALVHAENVWRIAF